MSDQEKSDKLDDYYQNCAFPKPKPAGKAKKKMNGYKDKPNRYCHYCGKRYAERHEIWGGPDRRKSIDQGFQVDVCREHHEQLQANVTEWAKKENLRWQLYYQTVYENGLRELGMTPKQARDMWMTVIGRNYLPELE